MSPKKTKPNENKKTKSNTYLTTLKCLQHTFFMNDSPSRSIDQNCPSLHLIELGFPEETLCLGIEREIEGDAVGR